MAEKLPDDNRAGRGGAALSLHGEARAHDCEHRWAPDLARRAETGERRSLDRLAESNTFGQTRHDGWTPARKAAFLAALAEVGTVRVAASRVGLSFSTAYRVRRRDADFAAGWDAALLLARDRAEDVLAERAIEGVEEKVFYHGEEVATRRRYDARLLLAHLGRLDRVAENAVGRRAVARFDDLLARIAAGADARDLLRQPLAQELSGEREDAALLNVLDGEWDEDWYGPPAPDMVEWLKG